MIENHQQTGPDRFAGTEVRTMDFKSSSTYPADASATVRRDFTREGDTFQEGTSRIHIEAYGEGSKERFEALTREAAMDCRRRVGGV